MATEEQKKVLSNSEVPSDSELFKGEVRKELSERDAFVGDEDFYRLLAESASDSVFRSSSAAENGAAVQKPARARCSTLTSIRRKRFSTAQKVLVVSIIAIVAILLCVLLKPLLRPVNKIPTPTAQQASPSKPLVGVDTKLKPTEIQKPKVGLPTTQLLSLKVAQNFYLQKDYDKAYAAYDQLCRSLPPSPEEELLLDFLQLRMALCLGKKGDFDQAGRLFKILSQSASPVVRVVANYNLSLLEMNNKQYFKARTRAYLTIAIIGAVDTRLRGYEFTPAKAGDDNWALSLQSDCHFLVAESMTRNILSLCDADADLPGRLWKGSHLQNIAKLGSSTEVDPFIGLSEEQLRCFLNSGSEQLKEGLLSPQIQKLEHQDAAPRWSIVAYGASIEELLARVAANAGLDISWDYNTSTDEEKARDAIRKRPTSLYLPDETTQQVVAVAAGHVGLLARLVPAKRGPFDEKGLLKISDPADYSSLSEHVSVLIQDTISLWRRFILTFHSDQRIPNAHFALGLLQAQNGQVADAIAQYKLVANRFSQASLAPYALLNSSELKANLHHYAGAREDLTQLVEQYPDTDFYGQACLNLADATKKAGLWDDAERLYRKVYNLGLSLELQTASALGAGRCSYETGDYETAAKWLTRYLNLAKDRSDTDLYSAYFLLGKTNLALEKPQQACIAFQIALSGQAGSLTREKYVETVSALVETQIQLEHFIDALALLKGVHPWQFSKKESVEILLLKGGVLRFMGLPDNTIATLGDIAEYLPDSPLKTRVSFELANCYIAKGDLEFAHKRLTEILILAEPGPLAHEISLKLAEVCLELEQTSQAVSVCLQLLDSTISDRIKQKTLKVLAEAYSRQKKFDDAALALLGQW